LDYRRSRATILSAIGLCLCLGARAGPPLPLREATWIEPAVRMTALTQMPPSCEAKPRNNVSVEAQRTGRIAFNAPLLLGGQAARAGLSCASCHSNGRGNPHFQFPGLSGAPGTADVTSSLMSKKRSDGNFNPKPIPDLAKGAPKISRDTTNPDLSQFIRGLIVEEFDGPEPSAAVLAGLTAYVAAVSSDHCRTTPEAVTVATDLRLLTDGIRAAVVASRRGDEVTNRLMLAAARSSIGRIHERYATPSLSTERAMLMGWDKTIAGFQTDLVDSNSAARLEGWSNQALLPKLKSIIRKSKQSLYDPGRLQRAL
jgi:hypothetical protein